MQYIFFIFSFFFLLGGIEILIDHNIYSGYNNMTNQSREIGRSIFASKPEENCVEVYFPSTSSVKFCEKKEMLSFVVALWSGFKNTTKGLLGAWNDNPDDEFTLPDGTVLASSSTLREIHFGFGVKCKYILILIINVALHLRLSFVSVLAVILLLCQSKVS